MKKYRVRADITMIISTDVEAESEEEAIASLERDLVRWPHGRASNHQQWIVEECENYPRVLTVVEGVEHAVNLRPGEAITGSKPDWEWRKITPTEVKDGK